jgi:serine O-acetyltransferase
MIDHGTGVVIGETAVVGKNCSFLHGVTLGSTGKEKGDRHPKIGDDVLIGCNTTVLGNISIGSCCKIGSGSIVLKSLPKGLTAVGNPARVVGKSLCPSASMGMDVALEHVQNSQGVAYSTTWSMYVEGENYAEGI